MSLPLALPTDEVSFWKWQKRAVSPRVAFRPLYDLGLVPWGGYVVDDEPTAGHEARHHQIVDRAAPHARRPCQEPLTIDTPERIRDLKCGFWKCGA